MAERSVRTAADGSASISDAVVSGIIGTPIEPVSARITALTLSHVAGRDFAAGMAFGKLVFGAGRFPESERTYLAGAGWSFTMLVAWDHSYRLMFSAPSGSAVIFDTNTFEWHSAALGDFSFDALTRTATGPFGAATTVNIEDAVPPLWEAGFYSGFRAVGAGADLSAWFLNLPAGLSAAAEASAEGALSAGFAFSGTPQAERTEEIEAEVPAASASAGVRLAVAPNERAVFAIRDGATSAAIYDVTVAGYAGTPIEPAAAGFTLTNEEFNPAEAGADCSAWFTNLPPGLWATAYTGISDKAENAFLLIQGTPDAPKSEAFSLVIPAMALYRGAPVAVTANPNAKFAIIAPPVRKAALGDLVVSGTTGQPLGSGINLSVSLAGESFTPLGAGADVSAWVLNLPAGLSATLAKTLPDYQAKINIRGTPGAPYSAPVQLVIPASALARGMAVSVAPNANAKWDILPPKREAVLSDVTVKGYAGRPVAEKQCVITLVNDAFGAIPEGTDITPWFVNMPAGLEAKSSAVADGAKSAAAFIGGNSGRNRRGSNAPDNPRGSAPDGGSARRKRKSRRKIRHSKQNPSRRLNR